MTEEMKTAATETQVEETTTVDTQVEAVTETTNKVESNIPEKYQGKALEDVIKMHQEAEKLIGKKTPTAPEEYLFSEEFKLDKKEDLVKKAKELNITQDQMKAFEEILVEENRVKSEISKLEADKIMEANQERLKKSFGDALEVKQQKIEEVLHKYVGEDLKAELESTGALHNPAVIEALDKITDNVLKHTMVGTDYRSFPNTPEQAKTKIAEKKTDKEFMTAYTNKMARGHDEAVAAMEKLFAEAYPE